MRDEVLGIPHKDYDYTVEAESFEAMRDAIVRRGGEIFLEKPEYFTIRARCPIAGEIHAADFVLPRKDGAYSDGRRPDEVEVGTLSDDLSRRDFTINAMARSEDGELIDPHNGMQDIERKLIRCVGGVERLQEDSLRMIRALRFAVQKGFQIDMMESLFIAGNANLLANISNERIREEVNKMLRANPRRAVDFLFRGFPTIGNFILDETDIWLKATSEAR